MPPTHPPSPLISGGSWADAAVKNPSENRRKILLIILYLMSLFSLIDVTPMPRYGVANTSSHDVVSSI